MIVLDWLIGTNIFERASFLSYCPEGGGSKLPETSVPVVYKFTWCHVSENWNLHQVQCENIISQPSLLFCFLVQNSCARLSFPQKNCHNFILVQVILTITACFSFPNPVQDSQSIIGIMVKYTVNLLEK